LVVAAIAVGVLLSADEALSVVATVMMAVILVASKSVGFVGAFVAMCMLLLADE